MERILKRYSTQEGRVRGVRKIGIIARARSKECPTSSIVAFALSFGWQIYQIRPESCACNCILHTHGH